MKCRHCNSKLENEFIDLGNAPPSNNYVSQDNLELQEKSYPLRMGYAGAYYMGGFV